MPYEFKSGRWRGYWTYPVDATRHKMELVLTFEAGRVSGEGDDEIGPFTIAGKYDTTDGACSWTKRYAGKHDVRYVGGRDSRGISGTWIIHAGWTGGFAIWPAESGDDPAEEIHTWSSLQADLDQK